MTTTEIIKACDEAITAIQLVERDPLYPQPMQDAAKCAFAAMLALKANALRVQLKY